MVKNIKIKTFLFTFLFISIFIILLIIFEISRKEVKLNLRPMFPTIRFTLYKPK